MISKSSIINLKRRNKGTSVEQIEKAFVKAFVKNRNIEIKKSTYLTEYLNGFDTLICDNIVCFISDKKMVENIDDLIVGFELLINDVNKKNNGMVYTPYSIKEYILEKVMVQRNPPKIIDPACGCGSFLVSAAKKMKERYQISYKEIFSKYIFGVDIDKHSIEKALVLFNLLALEEGEEPIEASTLLKIGNALDVLKNEEYTKKFDIVIGNPPYVRAKNIDESIKASLKNWTVVSGNVDLYIPFYQVGIELLNDNGKLGYISPNTFLQSVNGRKLRTYLVDLKKEICILDFRETQAFKDVTHYTSICIIDMEKRSNAIMYALLNGKSSLFQYEFTKYVMESYIENAEWRFGNTEIDKVIKNIEKPTSKLEDYKIRNGLATLKNDLFIFKEEEEDNSYYYRVYEGIKYKIEKAICINVAKPNIMRNENDLKEKIEKAIYPYKKCNNRIEIIPETELAEIYPETYKFLLSNKQTLLKRDKGKVDKYPAWYAYGRTQGMNNQGKKLLIPYMAEKGVAIVSQEEDLLFYCGYAIFSESVETLQILKKLIESRVFLYYISNTSKPYSKGYMSLAKNYIKTFGIPNLNEKQRKTLLSLEPGDKCEKFVAELYELTMKDI